eukprot:6372264-Amphidinium_carterae.1
MSTPQGNLWRRVLPPLPTPPEAIQGGSQDRAADVLEGGIKLAERTPRGLTVLPDIGDLLSIRNVHGNTNAKVHVALITGQSFQ